MSDYLTGNMREELRKKRNNHGAIFGFATYFVLLFGSSLIPPISRALKSEFWYWPMLVILVISVIVGFIASAWKDENLAKEINSYSDEDVRYHYERYRENKLRNDVIAYIAIALVIAYFLFR